MNVAKQTLKLPSLCTIKKKKAKHSTYVVKLRFIKQNKIEKIRNRHLSVIKKSKY